jgi:hypothetical protein
LVVELIKRKKAIHQANHALVIAELSVEEELAWSPLEEDTALEAKLSDIKAKQYAGNAQLHRAYFYSLRHSHGPIPLLCSNCFVDHGKESSMIEVTSDRGNGIRQFECSSCGHVVRANPV